MKRIQFHPDQGQFNQLLVQSLNGFSEITAKFTNANTNTTFTHGLGKKPTSFILLKSDKAVRIFATASTSWTAKVIVLQADNNNVNTVIRVE